VGNGYDDLQSTRLAIGFFRLRPVLVDCLGGGEMSEHKMREALELAAQSAGFQYMTFETRQKIEAALSQREAQEPVAWMSAINPNLVYASKDCLNDDAIPLYTAAPSREVPEGWKLLKDTTYAERARKYPGANVSMYLCTCCICLRQFEGDKREIQCQSCADESARALLASKGGV
jgi:hypothetical protein